MAILQVIPNIEIDFDAIQEFKPIPSFTQSFHDETDVVFIHGNDPSFISDIKQKSIQVLSGLQIKSEQKSLKTFIKPEAIPEIVLVLLTAAVLPVVTSVLSDAIYDWVKTKIKKDNDADKPMSQLSVKIIIKGSNQDLEYSISGTGNDVVQYLENINEIIIKNSYMNGSSHVAIVLGNGVIVENTDPNGFDVNLGYYQERFNHACKLNVMPEDVLIAASFVSKGVEHANKKEYDEAIAMFNNALQIDEWCIEALYNLSTIYLALGDLQKARKCINRAIVALHLLPELGKQNPKGNAEEIIKKLYKNAT